MRHEPIGTVPSVVTPPVLVPVPTGQGAPVPGLTTGVESWDEVAYTCKAGDDYRKISARFYQSEAYAEALQLYNRKHPRAGESVSRDGMFVPGDTLHIPPSAILEKKYGSAIPKSAGRPAASSATAPVPASFRPTAPSGPPSSPFPPR